MTDNGILTIDTKTEEGFLRKKTDSFRFEPDGKISVGDDVLTHRELNELIQRMKKIMHRANGVGLSANQIGLPYRLFVAQVPSQGDQKFYAVLNPELERVSSEKDSMEEGCLSVLGTYGQVPRAHEVLLRGIDKNGKPLKIKAWGFLARVFQHETDHLNGVLFVDKAKTLQQVEDLERK